MRRRLRRYQLYVNGQYHGYEEGWDLTGPVAVVRLVAEIFGSDAAMRLRFKGNTGRTMEAGVPYEVRAEIVK